MTWVAGRPAAARGPRAGRRPRDTRFNGRPWPVQVGLSEAEAAALGVRPGAASRSRTTSGTVKRPGQRHLPAGRPADPAWQLAPWLLHPVAGGTGGQHPARRPAVPTRCPTPGSPSAGPAPARSGSAPTRTGSPGTRPRDWPRPWPRRKAVRLVRQPGQLPEVGDPARRRAARGPGAGQRRVRPGVRAADRRPGRRGAGPAAGGRSAGPPAGPALIAARQRGAALPDLAVELLLESLWWRCRPPRPGWPWPPAGRASPVVGRCRSSWPGQPPGRRSARWPPPGPPATGARRPTARARRWAAAPRNCGGAPSTSRCWPPRSARWSRCTSAASSPPPRHRPGPGRRAALPASAPALGVLAGDAGAAAPAAGRHRPRAAAVPALPAPAGGVRRGPGRRDLHPGAAAAGPGTSTALAAFALTLDTTGARPGRRRLAHRRRRRPPRPRPRRGRLHPRRSPRARRRAGGRPGGHRGDPPTARAWSPTRSRPAAAGRGGRRRLPPAAGPHPAAGRPGPRPAPARAATATCRPWSAPATAACAPACAATAAGERPVDPPGRGRHGARRRRPDDVVIVDAAAPAAAGLPVVPNTIWVTGPGAGRARRNPVGRATVSAPTSCATARRAADRGLLRWPGPPPPRCSPWACSASPSPPPRAPRTAGRP